MKKFVLPIITVLLATPALADNAPPGTVPGVYLTWKHFRHTTIPFEYKASPCTTTTTNNCYTPTGNPTNPTFTKKYDDTFLECIFAMDYNPHTIYPANVAVAIDGATRMIKAEGTAVPYTEVTATMTYFMGPGGKNPLKAGPHQVLFVVWSHGDVTFHTEAENLQCIEMVMPENQSNTEDKAAKANQPAAGVVVVAPP